MVRLFDLNDLPSLEEPPSKRKKTGKSSSENEGRLDNSRSDDGLLLKGETGFVSDPTILSFPIELESNGSSEDNHVSSENGGRLDNSRRFKPEIDDMEIYSVLKLLEMNILIEPESNGDPDREDNHVSSENGGRLDNSRSNDGLLLKGETGFVSDPTILSFPIELESNGSSEDNHVSSENGGRLDNSRRFKPEIDDMEIYSVLKPLEMNILIEPESNGDPDREDNHVSSENGGRLDNSRSNVGCEIIDILSPNFSVQNTQNYLDREDNHLSSKNESRLHYSRSNDDLWMKLNNLPGDGNGTRIGKLLVSNTEIIAKGSNGTIVFEGFYELRPVAVKRLVKGHHDDDVFNQIKNLIESDRHPNIVRYYGVEYDRHFVDVVSGLAYLHVLGIIHRDLKPQNVLITKNPSLGAQLCDMGISRCLPQDKSSLGNHATSCGTSGWQSPEQLCRGRQTRAMDMFSLGCVLFFCVTSGRHPFGECLERDINIKNNKMDLSLVESIPEVHDLISLLLNPDPKLRPKSSEVLRHPMFWSSEMRLSFLRDTSDRVLLEVASAPNSDLLNELESKAPLIFAGNWDNKIEPIFMADIRRRRYDYSCVRDLLRAVRNKWVHYIELSEEVKELIGRDPEGYDNYFAERFPRLLMLSYEVVSQFCKEEECFRKYFGSVDAV